MDISPLQLKYAELCQKLGDLTYKKSQIESQISEIEVILKGLNFAESINEPTKRKGGIIE